MFGEDVSTQVSPPATNKLSEVREDANQLNENKGYLLNSLVEDLLFIMIRYRPDLKTTVRF